MADSLVVKNGKKICWRKLTPDDKNEVDRLIIEEYSKNEPMWQSIVATDQEKLDLLVPCARTMHQHNTSIGAYDEGGSQDKLCGMLLLSSPQTPSHENHHNASMVEDGTLENSSVQIFRFLDYLIEGSGKYTGNSKYLIVELAVMENAYCKMGIMTNLFKKAELVAKEHECPFLVSEFTSKFTQKIGMKLGYVTMKDVKYEDYVDDVTGQKPFVVIDPVHTSAKSVYLDLNSR